MAELECKMCVWSPIGVLEDCMLSSKHFQLELEVKEVR